MLELQSDNGVSNVYLEQVWGHSKNGEGNTFQTNFLIIIWKMVLTLKCGNISLGYNVLFKSNKNVQSLRLYVWTRICYNTGYSGWILKLNN